MSFVEGCPVGVSFVGNLVECPLWGDLGYSTGCHKCRCFVDILCIGMSYPVCCIQMMCLHLCFFLVLLYLGHCYILLRSLSCKGCPLSSSQTHGTFLEKEGLSKPGEPNPDLHHPTWTIVSFSFSSLLLLAPMEAFLPFRLIRDFFYVTE